MTHPTPRKLPVVAFLLAACASVPPAVPASSPAAAPPPSTPPTVAVTPFDVVGTSSLDGRAIASDLATLLAGREGTRIVEQARVDAVMEELKVRAGGLVSDRYDGDIGEQLGADVLVRGQGQVVGATLRLIARLVDFRTGVLSGGVAVSGPESDLFRLEDELADAIAALLRRNRAAP